LGTDAVIVGGKTSPEPYHDYGYPSKFEGNLSAIYDDHDGTVIYQIPRIHPGIGRVVDNRAIDSVGKLRAGDDVEILTNYVNAVENANQPLTRVTWTGFDEINVEAKLENGQSLLLQETYDPAWKAEENGRPLVIRSEPFMQFMLIDLSPGPHRIRLRFETPLENRLGQLLFGVSVLVIAGLTVHRFRRSRV
jgi:hypothetical protein